MPKLYLSIVCLLILIIVFVLYTKYSNGAATESLNPETLGCSVPTFVNKLMPMIGYRGFTQWQTDFNDSCVRHDYCYRCSSCTYGKQKQQCDQDFRNDMNSTCYKYENNSLAKTICHKNSTLFYWAVKLFGGRSFLQGDKCINFQYE